MSCLFLFIYMWDQIHNVTTHLKTIFTVTKQKNVILMQCIYFIPNQARSFCVGGSES